MEKLFPKEVYLAEVDSFKGNKDFNQLIGYFNTGGKSEEKMKRYMPNTYKAYLDIIAQRSDD